MFHAANFQKLTKYVFLSFLCLDSVLSAAIETAQNLEDDEDRDIYGDVEPINDADENIFRNDFFRFTTRKRYIWEDWTVTTDDPGDFEDYEPSNHTSFQILLVVGLIFGTLAFTIAFTYIIKRLKESDCCSDESYSHQSADIFTTVHRPPGRRANLPVQVHRPPRDLFNELDSNLGAVNFTGTTISFVNSTYASSSQGRTETANAVPERPPDYATVALNDFVNPTQPAFPAVKKDTETPPPEYGKGNSLFK
ncbi:uncharacterized protein LOC129961664 [Argiope bruennichi]|nr:uncharacterized protein LOC129961664 [Argiope bruennichi]